MQCSGYAIIQRTEYDLADYMTSPVAQQNLHLLEALRAATRSFDVSKYRGIGRSWIQPFPSLDDGTIKQFADSSCDMATEAAARRRFRELMGETEAYPDFDEGLLESEAHASDVFSRLRDARRFELLRLWRREFVQSVSVLGYDIGYWGGDHYSLISDSLVAPHWHPPQPEAFHTLANRLSDLNEHLLFSTVGAAIKFRAWYRTQAWAETESHEDEFEIIQVCANVA